MKSKPSITRIPGYKYNEYKLVIYPNAGVSDKIQQVTKDFADEYKIENRFESKPAMTMVQFVQFEMIENRLINRLRTIAREYHPFMIELNGFGSLPSHTIYINIESKQTVQNLSKELRTSQNLMTLNKDNKPHFIREPQFILAGKLLPWQYEKGWLQYSHLDFRERFIAEEMTLLKRSLASSPETKESGKNYRVVQRFEFMNQPVTSKQGDLFT